MSEGRSNIQIKYIVTQETICQKCFRGDTILGHNPLLGVKRVHGYAN
jgi:hypothetical protein